MERLNTLKSTLEKSISGEILFDDASKHIYSVDASIFEISPLCVVVPKTSLDIIAAIKIAKTHQIPIIPRGAATGISGGCIGKGMIIDTSRYLNKILHVDYKKEYVVCEPGVVQDTLNQYLAPQGYRLGPDTSTGNRATIGGMVANNSAGARSLFYGKMVDHVLEVKMVLSTGEELLFKEKNTSELEKLLLQESTEAAIYRQIIALKETHREEIKKRFPKLPRRVSGYNLEELIKESPLNLSKIITGSEGTFGIITEVKLRIVKKPNHTGFCLLFFNDMYKGMQSIPQMLEHSPLSVEMIDKKVIAMGKVSPAMKGKTAWVTGDPDAIFIVEFQANSTEDLKNKISHFQKQMQHQSIGYDQKALFEEKEMNHVWAMRKSGLGLLLSKRTYQRAIAFIEDLSVPPEKLATFVCKLQEVLTKYNKEAGFYGHAGAGCLHIRPYIDLRDPKEITLVQTIMIEILEILKEDGGALSGEHGDGLIRSWLNERLFGKELYEAFQQIKKVFDPLNLMNPGKIINEKFPVNSLRTSPKTVEKKITPFLNFDKEGGFSLSVDLCNGNATCRKTETLMCPPFHVTQNERHTTRARAQMLRALIHEKPPKITFSSQDLYDTMDLCIECKGCKKECPSQVDLAKMKSEFLYQYYQTHRTPLRNYLFCHIGMLNKLFSYCPSLFNKLKNSNFSKATLSLLGITPNRELPNLAKKRFSEWVKEEYQHSTSPQQVALFIDTYTEFNHPEIGIATVKVLQYFGFDVSFIEWNCCGRAMISKGQLPQARKKAKKLMKNLLQYTKKNIPVIILEPSCLSAVIEDYEGLFQTNNPLEIIKEHCTSLEAFLLEKESLRILRVPPLEVHLHGHCHQKALFGTEAMKNCLESIKGVSVKEIPSGCCGVAGSFGYEKEHYDLSMEIGNLHLIPYIEKLGKEDPIIANGISCRSQIQHCTDRKALHIAEFIANLIPKPINKVSNSQDQSAIF